jgi:preprotein translocase subunit SecF
VPFELVPVGTHIDFIGKRRLCAVISIGFILVSLAATQVLGVKLGIDFAGGTEMLLRFEPEASASDGRLREIISAVARIEDPEVVTYGDPAQNEFLVKFKGGSRPEAEAVPASETEVDDAAVAEISAEEPTSDVQNETVSGILKALAEAIGPVDLRRVDFVGPRVGVELRDDGVKSLLWASLVILIYVAIRFSPRFAPGAIVAVIHDLAVTAGVFVILGMEFDLRVLAAMLAILGYSLNDTIIIYDRIRENMELHTKLALPDVLNTSVNQTLSRTVLTSGTTILALLALYTLGGDVIRPFAFAMLIGVVVGTYSSIYIAAPVLLVLEEKLGGIDSKKT